MREKRYVKPLKRFHNFPTFKFQKDAGFALLIAGVFKRTAL
jgi:hypothetical protein